MTTITEDDLKDLIQDDPPAGDPPKKDDPPAGDNPDDKLPEEFRSLSKADLVARLQQQGQMVQALMSRVGNPPPASEPASPPPEIKIEADDLVDPEKLQTKLDQLMTRKSQPLVAEQQNLAAVAAYQNAKATLPHFERFEQEILTEIRSRGVPAAALANPMTWQLFHTSVLSRNMQTLVDEQVAAATKKPLKTGFSERPGGDNASDAVELSVEEKQTARLLGVSEKQYADYKKLMT